MKNDLLLRACRRQPVERPPVWIMRQAGRYLPEYRTIRANTPFLTLCKTPELAVEVSLQPLHILGTDAVILFSDILIPTEAMGMKVEITENKGPYISNPIRTKSDVDKLCIPDPIETMPFTFEVLRKLRKEINEAVPLIGFAGAPWTLAAYMIEGKGSKNYDLIKTLMYNEPRTFHYLMEKIADTQVLYLLAQIEAGAQVIQLFDSWAGQLSPEDFEIYSLPYLQKIFSQLPVEKVSRILYINGTSHLIELMEKSGADVLSIDWRTPLLQTKKLINKNLALQGNIDPCRLLGPIEDVVKIVKHTLNQMHGIPGYILNLGHGILPSTPVENAKAFISTAKGNI